MAIEHDAVDARLGDNITCPLSSEEGTRLNVFWTFTSKPRPESGLDCLMCAKFARQRLAEKVLQGYLAHKITAPPPRTTIGP